MNEAVSSIIVALVSGAFSLAGFIYGNTKSQSKTLYRLDLLEEKQDKHNSLIERMYKNEGEMKAVKQQLGSMEKRVTHIEGHIENNYMNLM